jgi:plasmid stabilization system protein ParE
LRKIIGKLQRSLVLASNSDSPDREMPYMGEATRKSGFRRFPVGNYLIVYEVGQDEVVIHYIRHGARRRPWEGE